MNPLSVGWYNQKLRKITHIEPWEDSSESIAYTSTLLAARYQTGDGKRVFPSYIWVAFDMVETLRIFFLNENPDPKESDLEHIKDLVIKIRQVKNK